MAVGTGVYVLIAAWFCTWDVMHTTLAREQFIRSLKMAVWIKAALLVATACGIGLWAGLNLEYGCVLLLGLVPDLLGGVCSLTLLNGLTHTLQVEGIEQLNSFWSVLAITLVQGAFISAFLALIADGLWRVPWSRHWLIRQNSFPTQIWG